ncbi:unnamed protein product [Amoebophrya sp. A25]|nr:unnamed protein product [Amoebophrya sp. A25]|eukprot:GSA25T00000009001.1
MDKRKRSKRQKDVLNIIQRKDLGRRQHGAKPSSRAEECSKTHVCFSAPSLRTLSAVEKALLAVPWPERFQIPQYTMTRNCIFLFEDEDFGGEEHSFCSIKVREELVDFLWDKVVKGHGRLRSVANADTCKWKKTVTSKDNMDWNYHYTHFDVIEADHPDFEEQVAEKRQAQKMNARSCSKEMGVDVGEGVQSGAGASGGIIHSNLLRGGSRIVLELHPTLQRKVRELRKYEIIG